MIESFLDGNSVIRTGFPDQDLNVVFIFKPPECASEIVQSARQILVDSKANFEVVVSTEAKEAAFPIVRELNLTMLRKDPGMFLDRLPESVHGTPDNLEIRRVKSPDELSAFFKTMNEGFGSRSDLFDPFVEEIRQRWMNTSHDTVETPSFYLGYYLGRPVSTSLRITTDGIAGIYGVSTLEQFRRRGFGEAMVQRALVDGRLEEACRTSFLQASEMGRPIYERIGYRVVSEYEVWSERRPMLVESQGIHVQV